MLWCQSTSLHALGTRPLPRRVWPPLSKPLDPSFGTSKDFQVSVLSVPLATWSSLTFHILGPQNYQLPAPLGHLYALFSLNEKDVFHTEYHTQTFSENLEGVPLPLRVCHTFTVRMRSQYLGSCHQVMIHKSPYGPHWALTSLFPSKLSAINDNRDSFFQPSGVWFYVLNVQFPY